MADKKTEIASGLNEFYTQPIARVSFELIITIVVVMFFALFAIRPTLLTMSDLIKEIEDKRALEQALEQKIAALSTAQTEYLAVQNRLPLLDEALPSDPNVIQALNIIEKIASDRQVAITNVGIPELPDHLAPGDGSTDSDSLQRQNLILKVTLASDYLTIQEFIKDLQNSRRMIVVDAIDYNVNENQANKSLRAVVTLNMPYFGTVPTDDTATPTNPGEPTL